jgi:dCMP deaminase
MNKWDARFYSLAKEVAMWSKDENCQVGCVAVSTDHRQFTVGYNGYPKGYPDTQPLDKALVTHAELNCILNARVNITGWNMYCTKAPCVPCAKAIATSGITALICPAPTGSWTSEQEKATILLRTLNIHVRFVL